MTEANEQQLIRDVLCRHSRGLDRLDEALLKDCYWPDAEVDYGVFKGPAHQFAGLVMGALREQYELTRHVLSNILVEISGDEARSETLVDASHLLHGAEQELVFAARYLDKLHKRGEEWKILHRQVVVDWCQQRPLTEKRDDEAYAGFARGTHDGTDPLHTFLTAS